MGNWWIKLLAGLWGLRERQGARDEKILGVGEAEIAGDKTEIGAPLILVFADGLEYCDAAGKMNVDE